MPYISEPSGEGLSDQARKQQEKLHEQMGYVPNYAKIFGHRPDVLAAWGQLIAAIRGHMDQRRYELITIAAARALHSSYCQLAHSSVLLDAGMFTETELAAVARDYERAGLTEAEAAMMAFAQQVVRDASAITADDVAGLRRHGLGDAEILDVVLAASARCFLSKTSDGVGAQADPIFERLSPALREVLVTGRPIQPAG
jgi:uncharacterized peroxidase-related enzyme